MLRQVYNRLFGTADERVLRNFQSVVDDINTREASVAQLSVADLQAQTERFRQQIRQETAREQAELEAAARAYALAEPQQAAATQYAWKQAQDRLRKAENRILDELRVDAFTAVREACKRTLGKRHYDVQLLGGMVLHQGSIAEMKTGEGKTFVATLTLYLNALAGRGAHLVTPNDYLSKVGLQLMGPIYHLLGVSAAVIQNQGSARDQGSFIFDPDHATTDDRYQALRPITRQEAYAADITYGTNNEFGFDYLRDNMVRTVQNKVQRPLHYAIVDEVDNILIDEARTPLIISGVARESSNLYRKFASLVRPLVPDQDYTVAEKERTVSLTEMGLERIERTLGIDNLYGSEHAEMLPYLDNALRASVLYKRDIHYLVQSGQVVIVDEFTGRMMEGRRFGEGLHQAIEAKEGVRVQQESVTLASITFQNYFRMYPKLAGMTGTAKTEEEELGSIYDLDVVSVPTYKPIVRQDHTDVVYRNHDSKFRDVVAEIREFHQQGRPVLVGTVAIETSELLSRMLRRARIPHEVLNAKNHEREAVIIAQAGRRGAVTIATNMAGRGVDILLGGNPEGLAREVLRKQQYDLLSIALQDWNHALELLDKGQDPVAAVQGDWVPVLRDVYHQVQQERQEVRELGGLHVVGTERHESRRIDNQLRGRAGRLGDPGSSRFYLSLEDDLLLRFGGERLNTVMTRLKLDDAPIESGMIDRVIENAQIKVEGFYFDSRKSVLQYDEVMNEQRNAIYQQRQRILEAEAMMSVMQTLMDDELSAMADDMFGAPADEDEDVIPDLRTLFPPHSLQLPASMLNVMDLDTHPVTEAEQATTRLCEAASDLMAAKQEQLGDRQLFESVMRDLMLNVIDNLWTRHLTDLDHLREGIGLRALAQIQPIVAYQQEAYQMFNLLQADIRNQIVRNALGLELHRVEPATPLFDRIQMNRQTPATPTIQPTRKAKQAPGRNAPCHCGSGRKYKHCCMRKDPVPAG